MSTRTIPAKTRTETNRKPEKFDFLRRKKLLIGAILGLIMLVIAAVLIVPMRKLDAEDYFDQFDKQKINKDVERTLTLVKEFVDQTPDNFSAFAEFPVRGYKYSIAFTAYGLANVAFIEPSRRQEIARYLDKLIQRMVQYDVQADWWSNGYGIDPIKTDNVMYKGHLNLMYGLYELLSSDRKYEKDFKSLTEIIVRETGSAHYIITDQALENLKLEKVPEDVLRKLEDIKYQEITGRERFLDVLKNTIGDEQTAEFNSPILKHASIPWVGITCEPQNYYVECNTISIYSIKLYDMLYGTDHSDLIDRWFHYVKDNLRDEKTGLFCKVYHPTTDYPEPEVISYNNGWILTFLHGLYPEFAESLYDSYKRNLIREKFIWYAYAIYGGQVKELKQPHTVNRLSRMKRPVIDFPDEIASLGSLFAFYVASEMKDRDLFNKLLNSMSKMGVEKVDTHSPAGIVTVDTRKNFAIQGPLLFGKANIGLGKFLKLAEALAEQKRKGRG